MHDAAVQHMGAQQHWRWQQDLGTSLLARMLAAAALELSCFVDCVPVTTDVVQFCRQAPDWPGKWPTMKAKHVIVASMHQWMCHHAITYYCYGRKAVLLKLAVAGLHS